MRIPDIATRTMLAFLTLALAGCPSLRVSQVRLAAPPAGGKASLVIDVEARNEGKDPEGVSGEVALAAWLPPGWEPVEVRLRAPGGDEALVLTPAPEFAPEFPPPFPYRPGRWWPFVTGRLRLAAGESVVFPLEMDLAGPKKDAALVMGLSLGLIDDCELSREVGWEFRVDPPTEVGIDLRKGEVSVRERPDRAENVLSGCVKKEDEPEEEGELGLEEGEEMPIDTICPECVCPECPPRVDRGPRGCSCRSPGGATADSGLVRLLLNLLSI